MARKPGRPRKSESKPVGLDGEPLKTAPKAEGDVRSDEAGFLAGLPVNLDRTMKSGRTLREELSENVGKWLNDAIDAQQPLIDKISVWDRLYRGIKPDKNSPYPGCSNTAIPKTRTLTDAITVRIMDAVFGQIKLWIVRATDPKFVDLAPTLEDGLDWWQKNIVKFRKKIFSPLLQSIKTGTGIVMVDYTKKKRTVYRYAGDGEEGAGVYKTKGGQKVKKSVESVYDGPDIIPISREDFVISAEATDIQDAFLCGFRTFFRKPEMELKAQTGEYYPDILGNLGSNDAVDPTKEARAESQGKILQSDDRGRYEVWRLNVRYDVDEDGEEDDIVVSFHRNSKSILKAIYNPLFMGFRPFIPLVFYPSEYAFDGMGVCQVLEKSQVELDMIHNMRIDRLEQINAPMYLASRAAGFDESDNPFNIAPGYVRYIDGNPEQAIKELVFHDQYPSTYQEEGLLTAYMGEAVGVTPGVLGQSVSERPVARDTMALIQEANKKFKFGIDNIRYNFGEIGWMALEMFAQYQPRLSYYDNDATGALKEKTIEFPLEFLRDGVAVELMASSELMNTEVRREIDLTLYQLLSDFMTKTAGMVQASANPMLPPQMRQYMVEAAAVGTRLMKKIVEDFGVKDDSLVVDAAGIIATPPPPPMPMPGMMGMAGPGTPPGGQVAGPGPGQLGPGGPPMAEEGPPMSEADFAKILGGTEFGGQNGR